IREKGDVEYFELIRQLNKTDCLWQDPDFPATLNTITSVVLSPGEVTWKRPKVSGCHNLIGGLVTTAIYPRLLTYVVPDQQDPDDVGYAGVFRTFFWVFGSWKQVLVDDRVPVDQQSQCVFLHSNDSRVLWPCLLEKAYAKLNRGYGNLEGRSVDESLSALTGRLCTTIPISWLMESNNLQHMLMRYLREGSLITCDMLVRCEGRKVCLVKFCDFYGNAPGWTGAWGVGSLDSRELSKKDRSQLELFSQSEKEFWMTTEDLVQHFVYLTVCHTNMKPLVCEKYKTEPLSMSETQIYGQWKFQSAGGSPEYGTSFHQNPQYLVRIEPAVRSEESKDVTVYLSLMLHSESRSYWNVAACFYKVGVFLCGFCPEFH
ncbi:hypothetical protein PHET_06985, partial [Paragonimus heterotremus]